MQRTKKAIETARKKIEDVLTAEQRAAYRHDRSRDLAFGLGTNPQPVGRALGIDLSDLSQAQKQQFDRLGQEITEQYTKKLQSTIERLRAILTPQQRERLMARFTDADVAAPLVDLPPLETRGTNGAITISVAQGSPLPFNFVFASDGGASVVVYRRLFDVAVRKELALTPEQEEKLDAVATKSQAAARKLFDRYELKAVAPKPSPDKQKSERAEYQRTLEQFGGEVVRQIETVLQPRQVAAMKAIVRKDKAMDALMRQDRAVLDDLGTTPEQRANLRRLYLELLAPDTSLQNATGEKVLAILTPQQQRKLDEAVERSGM